MKKILVCGASGFIGHHLCNYLSNKGYWVRAVDINPMKYKTNYNEFFQKDLRDKKVCEKAIKGVDEIYQLAAQMGGMGFISTEHIASLYDSNLINTYTIDIAAKMGVKRYFFSSSACVYPISKQNSLKKIVMKEKDAIPAEPNEAYGWEKLVQEVRLKSYQEKYGIETRIARFENTYGPEGTYEGGREKAPAALCRKVSMAQDGDYIEVWGDGKQTRSFMYIDDCLDGIFEIMQGNYPEAVNLGNEEVVGINELAKRIIKISGKRLKIKNIKGPQGIRSRYIDHSLAEKLYNWKCKVSLNEGLKKTYEWIDREIHKKK